ncbi:unnamed protein product [Schistosoma curassoni]|uniref:Transposase n=1 Tax=Schistosoma curassoni TaxID=6186 RepID=A0A183L4G9_9TREM|nr:unnamed protein product [Schistosoma curassoni]
MYHEAIGMHVESLVLEGLSDTEIVQLLGWINSYQYVSKTIERLKSWLANSLLKDTSFQKLAYYFGLLSVYIDEV